jgi:hypothetical protein
LRSCPPAAIRRNFARQDSKEHAAEELASLSAAKMVRLRPSSCHSLYPSTLGWEIRVFFGLLCSIRARRSLSEVAVRSRAVGMGTTPDAGVVSEFGSSGRGRFGATWLDDSRLPRKIHA